MKAFQWITTAAGLLFAGTVNATPASSSRCKEVSFTVSGSAINRDLSGVTSVLSNLTALTALLEADDFDLIPVNGTQKLAGWYCEPSTTNSNGDKLQFLLGSITTNRESWTGQGGTGLVNPPNQPYKPEMYSWVDYANKKGYPTLALDHLGQGNSDHPDPILLVQAAYEIALYHDLVSQLKSGTTGQISRCYDTLYFVGNSYGSELGNEIAQAYPNDFAQMVLTGFSLDVLTSLPGVSAQTPIPAAIADPARFGTLSPGYVTSSAEQTRTNSFFGDPTIVDFEQQNSHLFFTRRDVVSVGQFISVYLGIVPAPAYTGRVLVLTGENDQAFCGLGSSALSPNTMCGPLLKQTGSLFPNANYNYQSIPKSGHALILHKSSQTSFKTAHDFFAGATFGA